MNSLRNRSFRILFPLFLSLFALIIISCFLGRYPMSLLQVIGILFSRIFDIEPFWNVSMANAVLNIRLPRILLACMVGSSLSAAGAVYQSVFSNPMAAPDFLGASSGASFGAALAILLGLSSAFITASAFAFGLLSVGMVFLSSRFATGKGATSLILAGIMVSSLFSSALSFLKLAADPANQLPAITYWLMGSLSGTKWSTVYFALPSMLLASVPILIFRWRLNLLTLNDDEARALGINVNRARLLAVLCATLLTASAVSVSGLIGYVGLVVPHLCRHACKNDCRTLIPASMLGGALFMLAADNISRCLMAAELPIGIITAFFCAPFFVVFVMRKGHST